jgi:hypothetical protein
LPLDGHDQGCDGQFRPHVVTHRPADDFPGEEIEHDGQIEPPFLGWHVGDVCEPNLIGPLGGEFLVEPVRSDRQIVMAVGGAYSESPRRYCPDAVMTHETFDAATARRVSLRAQGRVDPGRAISPAMRGMNPPDLGQQDAIGNLAWAFGPATPGIIPRWRDSVGRCISDGVEANEKTMGAPSTTLAPMPHAAVDPCALGNRRIPKGMPPARVGRASPVWREARTSCAKTSD